MVALGSRCHAAPAAVDPVVRFLAELAGPGTALELGVGSGRSP
jgi:hypothetical protein